MYRFRILMSLVAAGVIGAATLGAPTQARASYAVEVFDDGVLQGGITTIVTANSLIFSGSTTHFSITNGSGASNNPGGAQSSNLSLSSNEQVSTTFGTAGGTHTIQIVLSQTGFTEPTGTPVILTSSAGGSLGYVAGSTSGAGVTVTSSYQGFLDPTNTLFGQPGTGATPLESASASSTGVTTTPLVFKDATATANVPGATPYALTDVLTFKFTLDAGSGQNTANVSASTVVSPVPEPSSLLAALAGAPVLGLGVWMRRRRRAG